MPTTIQIRRSPAASWSASTVLADGEIGYETDTGNYKVGDGSTQWSSLVYQFPYSTGSKTSALSATLTVDNANDRVGIGTTTPSDKLSVAGTLGVSGATSLASTLSVGGNTTLTGDLAVNAATNADITTTTSTATVFNTNATTLNIGGAATTIGIGAATGTTTINNAAAITGSTTIGGSATVGGTLAVTGNTTLTGNLAVNGAGITTTSTGTATVFNTNAAILNVGQAASTVSIGATSGTATIRNATTAITGAATVGGNLSVTGTTTFTGAPSYATDPTSANELARKSYVDSLATYAALNSSTSASPTTIQIGAYFLLGGAVFAGQTRSGSQIQYRSGFGDYILGTGNVSSGTYRSLGTSSGITLMVRIS